MKENRKWLLVTAVALVATALFLAFVLRPETAAVENRTAVHAPVRSGGLKSAAPPQDGAAADSREVPAKAAFATLGAATMEVEKRIKEGEAKRAELIESGSRHGKHVMAFAVKQPSSAEIREIFAPFEALKKSAASPEEALVVERQIQNFRTTYGLTDGSWRALILIVPEDRSITPYGQSAPASGKADCGSIVDEMVVPKERLPGVPFEGVPGTMYDFESIDTNWRFSALIDRGDLKKILDGRKPQDAPRGE